MAPDVPQTMHTRTCCDLDIAAGRGALLPLLLLLLLLELLLDAGELLAPTQTGSGATAEPDLIGGAAGSGTPPLNAGPL